MSASPLPDAEKGCPENVLALVALPPPINGQAIVSAAVIDRLQGVDELRATVVDTGPGRSARGLAYHATRLCRVVAALCQEIRHARNGRRSVYTVVESGWGVLYNVLVIGLGRLLGYRLFLHHHTSAHTLSERASFRRLAWLAGRQAIHVVLGPAMADDLKRRYPKVGEVMIVHNACIIPVPERPSAVGHELPRVRLGFLSNLSDEKGLDVVLAVLRAGKLAGLNLVVRLAGPAMTAKAAADIAAAKQEFGGALEFLGPLFGPAKADFYNEIDLFLFPSRYRYEAQPLVVLEAMAHGLPVVVYHRCGYTAELVGAAGEVVADLQAFVSLTLDLCRLWSADPAALRCRAEASRARFLELRACAIDDLDNLVCRLGRIAPADETAGSGDGTAHAMQSLR